jgi:hypothetical protein
METTCTRCHQNLLAESCYCPHCGLPQLVYAGDGPTGQAPPEPWTETVRDASIVEWKPAMRAALAFAVPAGLLSSALSPVGVLGLFWMAGAAAGAVVMYMRRQRPAWITLGAGARIGLVTGLLAAWLAFTISGGTLFVQRFVLHQSSQIDAEWKTRVNVSQEMAQEWTAGMGSSDAAHAQAMALRAQVQAWMMSPWGHAGIEAFGMAVNSVFLLFFAAGGGAMGARLLARRRRPEV